MNGAGLRGTGLLKASDMADSKAKCCGGQRPPENFYFLGQAYIFNVDRAKRLVADGRAAVEVEEESWNSASAPRFTAVADGIREPLGT